MMLVFSFKVIHPSSTGKVLIISINITGLFRLFLSVYLSSLPLLCLFYSYFYSLF